MAITNMDDLTVTLDALQRQTQVFLGYRLLTMLALLACGLVLPSAMGMAAVCLSAVAGLACVGALCEFVARRTLLDVLSVREVIWPHEDQSGAIATALAQLLMVDPLGNEEKEH